MVDIGVYPNQEGSEKILDFMSSAKKGFSSLEEAAHHISKFLPHREKPKDLSGLHKNLRRKDNRFYWHWDPKFIGIDKEEKIQTILGLLRLQQRMLKNRLS